MRLSRLSVLGPLVLSVLLLAATPATAALVFAENSVFDTSTGLRWHSTLASVGQSGPQIPIDKNIGGGLRLATRDDVETLFTSNFPMLNPLLNTLTPTPIDPEVRSLIQWLGGTETTVTVEWSTGQTLELAPVEVTAWIAAPSRSRSMFEPPRSPWEYRSLTIGYGAGCASFLCAEPTNFFLSSSPLNGFPELSPTEAGAMGYFLVSSVPEPASWALMASGLLLLTRLTRRSPAA